MKSLVVASAILCALSLTACMTDNPPSDTEHSDELTADSKTPEVVTIPTALSFAKLRPDACVGELNYCADPRWSPHYPSFCQKSGCTADQAFAAAVSLCQNNCGNIDCGTMYVLGPC